MYEIQLFDEKQTEGIYKALTDTQGWGLNRTSNAYSYEDTFPGFTIMDEQGNVSNQFWYGFFTASLINLNQKVFDKYNFYLPSNIKRIACGAKKEGGMTEFHVDTHNPTSWTIVGFLTPERNEHGYLQVEDKKIDFEPGKFVVFKSHYRHNGYGFKDSKLWRVSVNMLIE